MPRASLIYLLSRARAIQADSITPPRIQALLNALNLTEIKAILEETVLKPYIESWDPENDPLSKLDTSLRSYYEDLLYGFMVGTDEKTANIIKPYLRFLEAENVKIIMKALYHNVDHDVVIPLIATSKHRPLSYYQRILDNESFEIAPDYVTDPIIRNTLLQIIEKERDDIDKLTLYTDLFLDRVILEKTPLYGTDYLEENFYRNALLIMRTLQAKISLKEIGLPLYPSHFQEYLQQAMHMESATEAFYVFDQQTPIGEIYAAEEGIPPEDPYKLLEELELIIKRHLMKKSLSKFNISEDKEKSLIGFINMKRNELEDIIRIANGIHHHLDPDKIKSELIRFQFTH